MYFRKVFQKIYIKFSTYTLTFNFPLLHGMQQQYAVLDIVIVEYGTPLSR